VREATETTAGLTTISDIVTRIVAYAPDADVQALMQAYLLSAQAHQGQFRNSGEPYLQHPLEVASILVDFKMDVDTIATALLHDALEDTPITKEEMTAQVGPVVTELVDGVTKIGKLKFRSKEELQAENFRKMMLAMGKDVRVILVKLADRLHNMRTLEGMRPDKQKRIAQETIEVYAPIANRLGLHRIKIELEDLCFRYLEPEAFARMTAWLDKTQPEREAYVAEVVKELQRELAAHGIHGRVSGRAKNLYSIWRKMQRQACDIGDVPDLLAFRLLVPDLGDCYAMLGYIHATYPPVPGRIKDYIARPKPNGYRSLHTTVVGPKDKRVEIQIRTEDMHRIAEEGVAAHWKYKEGHLALDPGDVVEIARIREAFADVAQADHADDFVEAAKVAFYADEVFVFTPAGEVKKFPLGSTPIDFAYAIHSNIGDTCTGAKVNGRIVPLDYALQSGDTVEILTRPDQHPRRDWLEIARTSSAIAKIRRWLRRQEEESAIRVGRGLLELELERFGWTTDRTRSEGRLDEYLKRRGTKVIDPVLVELARGTIPVGDVAGAILPEGTWYSRQEGARRSRLAGLLNRFVPRTKSRSPVVISGEDGLLVTYAGCCSPLPGEEVVGYITRGRGITIHRSDCDQLAKLDDDRRVDVEWDLKHDARHSTTLRIYTENKPGVLSSITKVCEKQQVNIERAEARATDGPVGHVLLQLAVRNLGEVQTVVQNIQKIPEVTHVERISG
jgi:GTP pyrophosphokinase